MAGWNPIPQRLAAPSGGNGGGAQGNPAGSPMGTPGGKVGSAEWAKKNRTTLLAGGAGVVVLLALVAKRRAGAGDTSAAAGTTIAGATPQSMAAYDSSSADTYNALQPQLEQIRDLLENWGAKTIPVPDAPTDSVTTPTTTAPVTATYSDLFGRPVSYTTTTAAGSSGVGTAQTVQSGNNPSMTAQGNVAQLLKAYNDQVTYRMQVAGKNTMTPAEISTYNAALKAAGYAGTVG